jgi:hypothetical protein
VLARGGDRDIQGESESAPSAFGSRAEGCVRDNLTLRGFGSGGDLLLLRCCHSQTNDGPKGVRQQPSPQRWSRCSTLN